MLTLRFSHVLSLYTFTAPGSFIQYEYFKTNWISRGVPTVEVIAVKLLGLSTSGKDGVAKLG